MTNQFYICDLRPEWSKKPCVTFWRPNNAGYAFPLPWSGKYTLDEIMAQPSYYWERPYGMPRAPFIRFPIACAEVDKLGAEPTPGIVDGDAGPIVWKTRHIVRQLRAKMLQLPSKVAA